MRTAARRKTTGLVEELDEPVLRSSIRCTRRTSQWSLDSARPRPDGRNKAAFKALEAQKAAMEADFGAPLDWQELPEGEGCRIRYLIEGGYKSPQEQWPAIHAALADAMVKLEKAMRARVTSLSI